MIPESQTRLSKAPAANRDIASSSLGIATPQQFEDALAAVEKGPLPSATLDRLSTLLQTFLQSLLERLLVGSGEEHGCWSNRATCAVMRNSTNKERITREPARAAARALKIWHKKIILSQ